MSDPIEWAAKKEDKSSKGPHPDYFQNKIRAKQFIEKMNAEGPSNVFFYMSEHHFGIETHRGKAKYAWPVSLHQSAEDIKKQVALILEKCKEFQT